MSVELVQKTINGDSPGVTTELSYFRFTPNVSANKLKQYPKVYLQAALHADEQPGIMVLHHLLDLLLKADKAQALRAEFVVVPMANPVGMSQIEFGQHQGRFDKVSGVNFNRKWPDLLSQIIIDSSTLKTDDAQYNQQIVRSLVWQWLEGYQPVSAREQQQRWLISEAYDADYVLDLHCDADALGPLFRVPPVKPAAQDLSDWIGAKATLTAEDSGGGSFDEVWPSLWIQLAKQYPQYSFPAPPIACTVEYRGNYDVFDSVNLEDAQRLFGFFQARNLIGDVAEVALTIKPKAMPKPSELAATEMLRVSQSGLLAYQVDLGEKVKKGQVIAELVPLSGEGAFITRVPICAGADGIVISRNVAKYVWAGRSIAKIVGREVLSSRVGYLLED
jgi:hypothetical protein